MWHSFFCCFVCLPYQWALLGKRVNYYTHNIDDVKSIKNACLMDFHTYLSIYIYKFFFLLLTIENFSCFSYSDTADNRRHKPTCIQIYRFMYIHQNNQNNIPVGTVPCIIIYLWELSLSVDLYLFIFCWWVFCIV